MDSPEVAHQLFEGLVAYETREDGEIATVPCLAESWEANGDATVWTFRLRRGVRFQPPVDREVTATTWSPTTASPPSSGTGPWRAT